MKIYTIFLLLSILCASISSYAAPGDTTTVLVHNAVDMTWNGNYDQQGIFPDGSTTYRKVIMTYTLGCASGGCSDWDYTTQIFFRRPTGALDSTVSHLDTISMNPLVVDTTWNVYEVIENMELGRVITPYGTYMDNGSNGFNNSWSHRNAFDVSDYVHLLKDTCDIRAHYSGWSSGFSVTLRFDFIEGTPPRDILSIQNLYKGSKGYATFNDFESTYFTSKTVTAPANAIGSRIFSTITGHGFDNNVSCAEFCPRQYTVKTNGTPLSSAMIWKDDCGDNPIYPQGGTWIYNRAGWCPGSKADIHEFEWPTFNAGTSNSIDFDMQNYTWSGNQAPSYIVDAHVVFYGANNFTTDASLLDIIAPSKHEEHLRKNPFCGNPIVKVKNLGSAPITTLVIEYGLNGAGTCSYTWTGNLPFLEETDIELPTLQWQGVNTNNPTFTATIVSVNGLADEFPQDNHLQSTYDVPDIYTLPFLLLSVRTNNYANETSYSVKDKDGNVILERLQGSMTANTTYRDSIFLSDGCYNITVNDGGGDGLGWWANTAQGNGHVHILNPFFTFVILKQFGIDFGNSINYNFVWNSTDSIQSTCTIITGKELIPSLTDLMYQLYPNPNTGIFSVEIGSPKAQDYTCRVYNIMGKLVHQQSIKNTTHTTLELNLENQASGVYLFEVEGSLGTKHVEKFVIAR
jgi:hypothetical protein